MSLSLIKLNTFLEDTISSFKWTNTYGVARSCLALGTLLTFLFNDIERLIMPFGKVSEVHNVSDISKISLFYILKDHLILAKWIGILALLFVITGWRPRFTGILHWWVTFSFTTSAMILDGGDQITQMLTLLLIPITLMDERKSHWLNEHKIIIRRNAVTDFKILFVRSVFFMITLQVCFIYFHASVGKYNSEEWVNGTAIYYWFENPIFGLPSGTKAIIYPILENPYVITTITWGTLIVEILLAFGIVVRDEFFRNRLLMLGILFHLSIGVFFGLWSFFLAMAGALILYLGPKNGFKAKYFNKLAKVGFKKRSVV